MQKVFNNNPSMGLVAQIFQDAIQFYKKENNNYAVFNLVQLLCHVEVFNYLPEQERILLEALKKNILNHASTGSNPDLVELVHQAKEKNINFWEEDKNDWEEMIEDGEVTPFNEVYMYKDSSLLPKLVEVHQALGFIDESFDSKKVTVALIDSVFEERVLEKYTPTNDCVYMYNMKLNSNYTRNSKETVKKFFMAFESSEFGWVTITDLRRAGYNYHVSSLTCVMDHMISFECAKNEIFETCMDVTLDGVRKKLRNRKSRDWLTPLKDNKTLALGSLLNWKEQLVNKDIAYKPYEKELDLSTIFDTPKLADKSVLPPALKEERVEYNEVYKTIQSHLETLLMYSLDEDEGLDASEFFKDLLKFMQEKGFTHATDMEEIELYSTSPYAEFGIISKQRGADQNAYISEFHLQPEFSMAEGLNPIFTLLVADDSGDYFYLDNYEDEVDGVIDYQLIQAQYKVMIMIRTPLRAININPHSSFVKNAKLILDFIEEKLNHRPQFRLSHMYKYGFDVKNGSVLDEVDLDAYQYFPSDPLD